MPIPRNPRIFSTVIFTPVEKHNSTYRSVEGGRCLGFAIGNFLLGTLEVEEFNSTTGVKVTRGLTHFNKKKEKCFCAQKSLKAAPGKGFTR
jgi:hypothetical protein